MFEWLFGKKAAPGRKAPTISGDVGRPSRANKAEAQRTIPTVAFDASRVSAEVRTDLEATLRNCPDIPPADFARIHQAALESVSSGRDLNLLAQALMTIGGLTKQRAATIARQVNNRATSIMDSQQRLSLGITHAIWLYSGAPCGDKTLDDVHSRLDGKKFSVAKGMAVGKRRIWPGMEEGCKCVSKSVIAGFRE